MATPIEVFGHKLRTATTRPIVIVAGPLYAKGEYKFLGGGKYEFIPGPEEAPPFVLGYAETVEAARRRVRREAGRRYGRAYLAVTVASRGAEVVAKS